VVDRLNGLVRQIIKQPEVEKRFVEMGYVTTGSTPEEYHAKLKFETERWTRVVKENNIKIES
jgi:tripartite-type tricarboxylate transporter receptor subunit TctC